jgi:hypothetical protein
MRSTIKHRMAHLERTIHAGLSAPGTCKPGHFVAQVEEHKRLSSPA